MIPGTPRILVCPHCGAKKSVLSLVSGNTCGGCQWSDGKEEYPMLPRVSPVQKCPDCGKYYFNNRRNEIENTDPDSWSFERGLLSYEEAKEAYLQFEESLSEYSRDECLSLYSVVITAYNDNYNRDEASEEATTADKKFFKSIVEKFLNGLRQNRLDVLFEAEFLREIGDFDGCLKLLEGFASPDSFQMNIFNRIKARAKEGNTKAFVI